MAIPWMVLLKTVPWSQVIANAPAIADGARKLWKKVGGGGETVATPMPIVVPPGGDVAQALRLRVEELSVTTAELQRELQTSSELIKALADQNAELIQRVEAHRVRLRWLSALVAVLSGVTVWVVWRLA